LLSRYDRYGLPFGTQICRNCGLISQTIHIEEQSMALFYDKFYWDLIWGGDESATFSGQLSGRNDLIPMIVEMTDFDANKLKIMEVGCGQGDPISKLGDALKTKYDLSLIACDYSNEALELAKKRGIKTIQGGMDALLEEG